MDGNIKFLTLLALALSGIVVSYTSQEDPMVVESTPPHVTVQLSDVQICDALVSDTLNETYLLDNEYSAVTVWNKLKTHNFSCTLVFGNLSMNDEPITSCDRLWVTFDGIAIDSGAVYIDDQHFEGYCIDSPSSYRDLKDAIDDYLESKARYISAVESYNSLLNQAAKDNVEKTKSEYLAANERLILEIS
ncbi:hypothetical protein [uncultured Methanomethylovorans sp.]|uniref:hypothetical protein n=1 Tax=uncultured Methanomethylovorans sp. TaxID=183759 RepID=UPI002AA889DF|nr:hypothetical protein [uncultured Methanomethylovorans sp.]